MVIQTISKRYQVIKKLSGSDQIEAYLCRSDQKPSDDRFLVMGLNGDALSRKILPYFMEFSSRADNGDFLDCFIQKGSMWLVFRYYEYPCLRERMEGEFLLEERLEASRTMMEWIVAHNLPYYLQYEALNPDNVVVSDASEVYFNYLLTEPEFLTACRMEDVQQNLAACLEILFAPELEEEVSAELSVFLKGLREKEYTGYSGIYRDYRKLYELLVRHKDEGRLKSRGWLLRMWERLKGFLKRLRKVFYWAVILGLMGFLIYLYLKPEAMPASRIEYNQIGVLKIQEETAGQMQETGESGQSKENLE